MNGDTVCVAPEFWGDTVQFSTLHGHMVMPLTSLNERLHKDSPLGEEIQVCYPPDPEK